MSKEWGVWNDPDTTQGMQRYAEAGLRVDTPDDNRALGSEALLALANLCGEMLRDTYKGNYPISVGDAETMVASVEQGETDLFTLRRGGQVLSMAALVNQRNTMGTSITFAELGRACESPAAVGLSSRALLKNRVPWAMENTDTDFLVSSTRAAGELNNGMPSGKGVQSVWWGGRRHGQIPMVTTQVGYDYRLSGIEPFAGFMVPTDPQKWADAVNDQAPLVVPRAADKQTVERLLMEGTGYRVRPRVVTKQQAPADVKFHQVSAPGRRTTARYVIAQSVATNMPVYNVDDVNAQLDEAFSQKVVLEADLGHTTEGAAAMERLHTEGWTLVGWQPSEQVYGALCTVFARLNPAHANELQHPVHHREYFDKAGLGATRHAMDLAYAAMEAIAANRYNKDMSSRTL